MGQLQSQCGWHEPISAQSNTVVAELFLSWSSFHYLKGNSSNFTHKRQFISHEVPASENIQTESLVSQDELCQAWGNNPDGQKTRCLKESLQYKLVHGFWRTWAIFTIRVCLNDASSCIMGNVGLDGDPYSALQIRICQFVVLFWASLCVVDHTEKINLKGQFAPKSIPVVVICPFRLFLCEMLHFGDTDCWDVCLLWNIMELEGTQLMVLKAKLSCNVFFQKPWLCSSR